LNAHFLKAIRSFNPCFLERASMSTFMRMAIAAIAAVGGLALVSPVHAGLVMTISDNQGTTPVTVVGTQPGGPGTDLVASFTGSFGPVTLIVSVGDSNSPTLSDPVHLITSVLVSGGTPTSSDIVTITVTDNGVTAPTGSNLTLKSTAGSNAAGNAPMTFQSTAAGTSTPLQSVPAGSLTGSVVTAPIAGATGSPYTISSVTTLTFAAGVSASASVVNSLEVTAVPEPGSIIVWSLVACSVGVPSLVRRGWARRSSA
jgi:hypothetical protein